jgi:hypothetical protein
MYPLPPPFAFFVLLVSGWVNRQQHAVIDYLLEENRVLRAVHRTRRCAYQKKDPLEVARVDR